MPARMTRSAPQSPFELPEVRAVVRATRLSCQNAGKAQKFTPVRGSSGESRLRMRWTDRNPPPASSPTSARFSELLAPGATRDCPAQR